MTTQTGTPMRSTSVTRLIPVMFCFFAMGFVDLVGIGTNYVKQDLALTDFEANLIPSLLFFWFLIFSVPTGLLMNRIGRKKTVLLSLGITFLSLVLPLLGSSFSLMLVAFSLLGIGNAIMQTSLNPLVSLLIAPSRLASTLTFGQFVKAIASFLAPLIAAWGATSVAATFGLGWRILFLLYAVGALLAVVLLAVNPIREEQTDKASNVVDCLRLLAHPFILLCFLGIVCHVGIDVGTNTTAPRLLMERVGMSLEEASFATSLYFIFRTAGCFVGAFLLSKISARLFFRASVVLILVALAMLVVVESQMAIYAAIGMIGLGNSNVFSVIFSEALCATDQKNEVSGLMIMGLFGGTVFPLAMGAATNAVGGQAGAALVMIVGAVYLIAYSLKIKK